MRLGHAIYSVSEDVTAKFGEELHSKNYVASADEIKTLPHETYDNSQETILSNADQVLSGVMSDIIDNTIVESLKKTKQAHDAKIKASFKDTPIKIIPNDTK